MKTLLMITAVVLVAVGVYSAFGVEHTSEGLDPGQRYADEADQVVTSPRRPEKENPKVIPPLRQNNETGSKPSVFEDTSNLDTTNSILVKVIDAMTGKPAPGAVVGVVDLSRNDFQPNDLLRMNGAEMVLGLSRLYRASDIGEVRVPETSMPILLGAVTSKMYGLTYRYDPAPLSEIEIEIRPTSVVTANVVTEKGTPVPDVAVGLYVFDSEVSLETGERMDRSLLIAIDKSDINGQVTLPVLEGDLDFRVGEDGRCRLGIQDALRKPVFVNFDHENIPDKPVKLTIPAVVRLDLKLLDSQGAPVRENASLAVAAVVSQEDSVDHREFWRDNLTRSIWKGESHPVIATTGSRVRFVVYEENRKPIDETIQVVAESGETQVVELRFGGQKPRLTARLVDYEGHPLANRSVKMTQSVETMHGVDHFNSKTDQEGKVSFPLDQGFAENEQGRKIWFTLPQDGPSSEAKASLMLPDGVMGEDHDLGVVELKTQKLKYRGIVTDSAGRPVHAASVTLCSGPDRSYASRPGNSATTDRLGQFYFFDDVPIECDTLLVFHSRFLDKETLVDRDQQHIRVRLQSAAKVVGQVAIPNGFSSLDVSIILIDEQGIKCESDCGPEGRFDYSSLEPGKYRLEFRSSHSPFRELAAPITFKLKGGDVNDVGFVNIANPGVKMKVRVTGPKEFSRWRNGEIFVLKKGTNERSRLVKFRNGICRFVVGEVPIDLEVSMDSCRSKILRSVMGGDVEVVLSRGIPVKILPKANIEIARQFTTKVRLDRGIGLRNCVVRNGIIYVPSPGSYGIELFYEVGEYGGGYAIKQIEPKSITVEDSNDVFEFEVDVTIPKVLQDSLTK